MLNRIIQGVNALGNAGENIKSIDGALAVASPLRQNKVGDDIALAFANDAAANTQKTTTIAKPARQLEEYELIVHNPSTETDLTVKVFAVETALGGATRDALIATLTVPKKQTTTGTSIEAHMRLLHGIFNGADCKLVVSNDTLVGAAGAFTATARLREVM